MLTYSYNPSSSSAWPPLMVAMALALTLSVGIMSTQPGRAEAADPAKITLPPSPVLNQAKHLIDPKASLFPGHSSTMKA